MWGFGMTEKRFKLAYEKGNEAIFEDLAKYPYPKRMTNRAVERMLNEQQSIIRRDETSIKTMMSNMEKLEEANDNMNLFIKQTIEPLLFNCVFELNTIESMSQVELANKIENEIIPFIQNFKYLKYESPEEEKQDQSE